MLDDADFLTLLSFRGQAQQQLFHSCNLSEVSSDAKSSLSLSCDFVTVSLPFFPHKVLKIQLVSHAKFLMLVRSTESLE